MSRSAAFFFSALAACASTNVVAQGTPSIEPDPRPRTDAALNTLVSAGGGALGAAVGIAAVAGGTALLMQVPTQGPPPDFFLAFVTAGLVMGPIAPALGALGAGLLAAAVNAEPQLEDASASFNVCLATGAAGYCVACAPFMLAWVLSPVTWLQFLIRGPSTSVSPPTPPLWQNPSFAPAVGAGVGSIAGAVIGVFVGPTFVTDALERDRLRASGVGGAVGAFSGALLGGGIGGLVAAVPDESASPRRGGGLFESGSRPTW